MRKILGSTFLFFLLSGFAFADGIPVDPNMVVNDPICDGCQTVSSGVLFTFSANSTGGGTTVFQVNPNGPAFTTLDIETDVVFGNPSDCPGANCLVHCSSNEFNCSVSVIDGVTNIHLFVQCDGTCSPGFPAGDVFSVDLDDPGATLGTGSWVAGEKFGAEANLGTTPTTPFFPTPEPSSAVMLITGVAALVSRKRIIKRLHP